MKIQKTIVSMVPVLLITLSPIFASAADMPKMPPSVDVQGQTLLLNGSGLRTATIFNVKVYKGGLYLPQRSSDAQQILSSQGPKVVRLAFLRDVSSQQAQDAWREDFKKNCGNYCAQLQPDFDKLVSQLPGAKNGDIFVYVFTPKGIHIIRNAQEVAHADNPKIAKTVLSFWLGKEPPSVDLKQAMLGLKPKEDIS